MEPLDRIAFVSALEVPADAVFVVKANRPLTVEQAERIEQLVSEKLPGRQVLVLPPDFEVDVLREAVS